MEDKIKNPLLHLCEAIENSDFADKKELCTEIKTIVWNELDYASDHKYALDVELEMSFVHS